MKKTKPTISYDKESEVLSIEFAKGRSVDSEIKSNMVIDYNKSGEVARVNFYDFNLDAFKSGLKAIKEFSRRSETLVLTK